MSFFRGHFQMEDEYMMDFVDFYIRNSVNKNLKGIRNLQSIVGSLDWVREMMYGSPVSGVKTVIKNTLYTFELDTIQ